MGNPIWVAYSGGVDSHVLLHLLAKQPDLKNRLRAIHINHGLNTAASQWSQHCAEVADALDVPFFSIQVSVTEIEKLGMEAAARQARYNAILSHVIEHDVVLTAQHQHDQAETLLIQLLRGAGPKGLAAMPSVTSKRNITFLRPFLNVTQSQILTYAEHYQLEWVEDPSNQERRWARNYLRHEVWPVIENRWPSAAQTVSRSAAHCAEAAELLDELAEIDLQQCLAGQEQIQIDQLSRLSLARQRNLIRYFIHQQSFPLPNTDVLQNILDEVCFSKQDATASVEWEGIQSKRYKNQLFIFRKRERFDTELSRQITSFDVVRLDDSYFLHWQTAKGKGISQQCVEQGLTLKFRQGGERIQLNESHHSSVKHLLQDWQIPPWMRASIPLIFLDEELILIGEYATAQAYRVSESEVGYFPVIMSHQ
jgi:tRNA(Ile)-lysidine synthase